jgi:hypothetical protein
MWGAKNKLDRKFSNSIIEKILDKRIADDYKRRPKGLDQEFLSVYVYYQIRSNSVIHDSYTCNLYKDSTPWPTKRIGDCFVGSPSIICLLIFIIFIKSKSHIVEALDLSVSCALVSSSALFNE